MTAATHTNETLKTSSLQSFLYHGPVDARNLAPPSAPGILNEASPDAFAQAQWGFQSYNATM